MSKDPVRSSAKKKNEKTMATVDEGDDEKVTTTRKEKEDIGKDDEKLLRELDYYHGYLAREDLTSLLKSDGDFIIRMTEVEIAKNSTTAKKEIVMSVMITSAGEEASAVKTRNVVIRRSGGVYRIDTTKTFNTVKDLIEFYTKNYGVVNKHRFILKNAVRQQEWEFTHEAVTFPGRVLGEGAYGMVKEGRLELTKGSEPVPVAVKMAKGNCELSKAKIKELMREARLMRNLKHKNVVRLYGVAVLEQPLYIILELINGGELKKYLATHVGKVDQQEKLRMCLGAAQGLDYLHKNGYIHRDIAARNCLYTEDKTVKISDFGLSRNATEYKMKNSMPLPIKWLSPETIERLLFTTKTDIYSFGVLIYEVFADGTEPWHGVVNAEVKKSVCGNRFLQLPDSCPAYLRAFIRDKVFVRDAAKRGTMSEVVDAIEVVLSNPNMPATERQEASQLPSSQPSVAKLEKHKSERGKKKKPNTNRKKNNKGTIEEKSID